MNSRIRNFTMSLYLSLREKLNQVQLRIRISLWIIFRSLINSLLDSRVRDQLIQRTACPTWRSIQINYRIYRSRTLSYEMSRITFFERFLWAFNCISTDFIRLWMILQCSFHRLGISSTRSETLSLVSYYYIFKTAYRRMFNETSSQYWEDDA